MLRGMSHPARFPFKTLVVAGVLSFTFIDPVPPYVRIATDKDMVRKAEFYPFSSFSMYATFSDAPFTVKITDSAGKTVRFETDLKSHASETKKTYEAKLKELRKARKLKMDIVETPMEVKQEAARHTLTLVKARPQSAAWLSTQPDQTLVLHEIIITFDPEGKVVSNTTEITRL